MHRHSTPPPVEIQRVLNALEVPPPPVPPDRPDPIEVEVHLHFERDGWAWVPGRAERWTRNIVYVRYRDPRPRTGGVWVTPSDVRRRGAPAAAEPPQEPGNLPPNPD